MEQVGDKMCLCGHGGSAHEHYRRGSDCALCAPGSCRRFRSASGLGGWFRRRLSHPQQGDQMMEEQPRPITSLDGRGLADDSAA